MEIVLTIVAILGLITYVYFAFYNHFSVADGGRAFPIVEGNYTFNAKIPYIMYVNGGEKYLLVRTANIENDMDGYSTAFYKWKDADGQLVSWVMSKKLDTTRRNLDKQEQDECENQEFQSAIDELKEG